MGVMSGRGGGGELQELEAQLEALEQSRAALQSDIERLRAQKAAIDEAIDALEQLDTGSTVQVPLGGGAYLRAEITDIEEVIVDLGGNYAAQQDQDGAVTVLRGKKETLDDRISDLQTEVSEVEAQTEQLEQRATQMQQQQLQQLQQQMQQGRGPDE